MKKSEIELLRKETIENLLNQKKSLSLELLSEKSKIASKDKQSSKSTRLIRKKIAVIETLIGEKLTQQVTKGN